MAATACEGYAAEVIVIGAGPAGSATAAFLAECGRDVLLLDRCHFPRDKPCGEFVNPAGAAILRELGVLNLLPFRAWRPLRGLLLRGPDGESVSLDYPGEPPPEAIAIRRLDLDAALVQRAVLAGVRFQPGCPVEEFLWEDGRVAGVLCRSDTAPPRSLRARLVVAAGGARSRLGGRAGLIRGSGERRFALVGHFRSVAADLDQVEMHALGWGYCGFALTAPGEGTAAMVVRETELPGMRGRAAEFFTERLERFTAIHARVRDAELVAPPRVTGPVHVPVCRPALPGLLLVGDAAGFFDPFTGRGITRALRGARYAAATADFLLDGGSDRHALREYSARCRGIDAAHLVEAAIRFFIDRPPLLRHVIRRFQEAPKLGRLLLGVAGDLMPPSAVLNPGFIGRLLARGGTGARPCRAGATWLECENARRFASKRPTTDMEGETTFPQVPR